MNKYNRKYLSGVLCEGQAGRQNVARIFIGKDAYIFVKIMIGEKILEIHPFLYMHTCSSSNHTGLWEKLEILSRDNIPIERSIS